MTGINDCYKNHLEACPLSGVLLEMKHGFEYFPVSAWNEADGAEYFQHGHLHFGIVSRQTLRDDFDG